MNKYVIYQNGKGGVSAIEIGKDETEEQAKQDVIDAGRKILHDHPLVGDSKEDAVLRYERSNKLQSEAKDIQDNAPKQSSDNIQSQIVRGSDKMIEDIKKGYKDRSVFRQTPLEKGLIKSAGEVLSVPARAIIAGIDAYKAGGDYGNEFAKSFNTPTEERNIVGQIATDPMLMTPISAEGLVAGAVPKLATKFPKAISLAEKYLIDPALMAEANKQVKEGENVGATDLALATGANAGIRGLGNLGQMYGNKVITSVIKAGRGKNEEGDLVENLMRAKTPEGKNAVGIGTAKGVLNDIYSAIDAWTEKQGKALSPEEVDNVIPLIDLYAGLKDKYTAERMSKKINAEGLNEKLKALDLEFNRMYPNQIMDNVDESILARGIPTQEMHEAKKDIGKLAKFDANKPKSKDVEVYKDLYGGISNLIGKENPQYTEATTAMAPLMRSLDQHGRYCHRPA